MRAMILAFTTMTVVCAFPVMGQGVAARDGATGLWIGGGIGAAVGKVGCDLCRNNWELAPAAQLTRVTSS